MLPNAMAVYLSKPYRTVLSLRSCVMSQEVSVNPTVVEFPETVDHQNNKKNCPVRIPCGSKKMLEFIAFDDVTRTSRDICGAHVTLAQGRTLL